MSLQSALVASRKRIEPVVAHALPTLVFGLFFGWVGFERTGATFLGIEFPRNCSRLLWRRSQVNLTQQFHDFQWLVCNLPACLRGRAGDCFSLLMNPPFNWPERSCFGTPKRLSLPLATLLSPLQSRLSHRSDFASSWPIAFSEAMPCLVLWISAARFVAVFWSEKA